MNQAFGSPDTLPPFYSFVTSLARHLVTCDTQTSSFSSARSVERAVDLIQQRSSRQMTEMTRSCMMPSPYFKGIMLAAPSTLSQSVSLNVGKRDVIFSVCCPVGRDFVICIIEAPRRSQPPLCTRYRRITKQRRPYSDILVMLKTPHWHRLAFSRLRGMNTLS